MNALLMMILQLILCMSEKGDVSKQQKKKDAVEFSGERYNLL